MPRHKIVIRTYDKDGNYVLTAVESFSLSDTFTDPLGECTITASGELKGDGAAAFNTYNTFNHYFDALRRGNKFEVEIDDAKQFVGRIQRLSHTIDPSSGWTISATAQGLLANSFIGNLKENITVKSSTPQSVKDAILKAMGPYGFNDIGELGKDTEYRKRMLHSGDVTINDYKLENDKCAPPVKTGSHKEHVEGLKLSELSSKPDDTAYGFSQRIMNRLGYILKCDLDGQLYVTEPDYDSSTMYRIVVSRDKISGTRTMGPFTYTEDNTRGFSESVVYSTPSEDKCGSKMANRGVTVTAKELAGDGNEQLAKYYTKMIGELFEFKPRRHKDKYARDEVMGLNTAIINLQQGTEDSVNISCTVSGYRGTMQYQDFGPGGGNTQDPFWTVNTIAAITADPIGMSDQRWWIYSREFVQDANGGQYTRLKLIPPYALQIGDASSKGGSAKSAQGTKTKV